MIRIENVEVVGWEHVVRGMRNPMNSWEKSDSGTCAEMDCKNCPCYREEFDENLLFGHYGDAKGIHHYVIGTNDKALMTRLRNAGTDHRKFMRMITVYLDITAPLYWWKEFDTYKVGTVANSCSTMHKIHEKEFELGDFSRDHLRRISLIALENTVGQLNYWRNLYLEGGTDDNWDGSAKVYEPKDKECWWQMIQLLPSSYNQRRTIQLNYEVLANMYKSRKAHKLDEWRDFCAWVESLPYAELITGGKDDEKIH